MSVTVVLSVAVATSRAYPAGTVLAGYRASLQVADQSAPAVTLEAADLSAPFEFPGIPAGQYVASVSRLDSAGTVVAQSNLDAFAVPDSITPPDVIGDAPAGISVSFK